MKKIIVTEKGELLFSIIYDYLTNEIGVSLSTVSDLTVIIRGNLVDVETDKSSVEIPIEIIKKWTIQKRFNKNE